MLRGNHEQPSPVGGRGGKICRNHALRRPFLFESIGLLGNDRRSRSDNSENQIWRDCAPPSPWLDVSDRICWRVYHENGFCVGSDCVWRSCLWL